MTDLEADQPAHVALRRRYGRWNAGAEAPPGAVFFEPERGRWVLSSYDAAAAVFEQREDAAPGDEPECPFARMGETSLAEARALFRKNLFFRSSPDLERLRRVLMLQIGPRARDRLEPELRAILRRLLAAALASDRREIEVVEEIVRPFIDGCIYDMIGVAQADRDVLSGLADTARVLLDLGPTEVETHISYLAFGGICRRVGRLLFEPEPPRTDLVAAVRDAVRSGTWTRDEAVAQMAILVIAARTSPMTAVASLIHQVASNPEAWAAARAGTLSQEAIIEETLRVGPPAAIVPKTIGRDLAFDGVTLNAGEHVLLLVGSANRDPAVFPDPHRFNPWRERRRNMAFGAGRHKCPGQKLALLQMSVVLSELLERFPTLEVAAPPERGEMIHGERPIARLLIRKPAGAGAA